MNSTLAIAQRELVEKRFVFVAAAAFLVLALIIPFMPGVHASERAAALFIVSFGLALTFALGLSAILGSSIVGRELSEGRLSFYFSKPMPATSIWWGKLLAAAALILGCFAIIGLPALMTAGDAALASWTSSTAEMLTILAAIFGSMVALFLLTHVIGTFVRSRSAWFLFDFIAAGVCGMATWMLVRPLLIGFAVELVWTLARIFAVFLAVAILAAGAWQVARGRTDRRRSHMELSRFLWASIGSGLLVFAAFVTWVVSAPVGEVASEFSMQAASGPWSIIEGRAKHRGDFHTAFLYNVDNGRSIRISTLRMGAFFSTDGKTAAWFGFPDVRLKTDPSLDLYVARLNDPEPKAIDTGIPASGLESLSSDGSRALMIKRGGILSVYDLRSLTSLGSAHVPGDFFIGGFVNDDLIRVYGHVEPHSGQFAIYEYDLKRKTLLRTGSVPHMMNFSAGRTRGLLYAKPGFEVRDARTGALIATIQPRPGGTLLGAKILGDGRIVAREQNHGQSALRVLSGDGTPIRDVAIQGMVDRFFMTEAAPGLVVVIATTAQHSDALVVDVNRGVITRVEHELWPVSPTAGPRLLCRSPNGLVVWNPATGEKRPIG